MKLNLEKGFLKIFSEEKPYLKIGLLLLLGLILIFLSGFGGERVANSPTEEEKIAEMCSMIEGVGECRVMMTYRKGEDSEEVYAVLVLCDGGESVSVREKIISMFSSLYGIGSNRIEIQRLCE